ncbi:MAG: hypothetical protein UT05_C0003G0031 [Parcubacteria group bacterium GW2011_GWF2_38_76]|nr:MAG: hypothetical protein UT05_C0003G0031 [Parcubacteria group bacterium GW2011_GWF2_38_76]
MIDDTTKQKLLKELEKSGNVWSSCLKLNIHRSTYYRWKKTDKKFGRTANTMERHGRENMCDIAKHALMLNVKDKKMDAIKYVLGHYDPLFKRNQTSNVVIVHKKESPMLNMPIKTLEDLFDDDAERAHQKSLELQKKFTGSGKIIPNKPDGNPIEFHELIKYEAYIEDWQRCQKQNKSTDTADSMSETDKPTIAHQENQMPSDNLNSNSASQDTRQDNNT